SKAKPVHELIAVGQGLGEVSAGVEEDHWERRVSLRRHMKQHDALGTERGNQGRPAVKRTVGANQRAQQSRPIEETVPRAEALELRRSILEHRLGNDGWHQSVPQEHRGTGVSLTLSS